MAEHTRQEVWDAALAENKVSTPIIEEVTEAIVRSVTSPERIEAARSARQRSALDESLSPPASPAGAPHAYGLHSMPDRYKRTETEADEAARIGAEMDRETAMEYYKGGRKHFTRSNTVTIAGQIQDDGTMPPYWTNKPAALTRPKNWQPPPQPAEWEPEERFAPKKKRPKEPKDRSIVVVADQLGAMAHKILAGCDLEGQLCMFDAKLGPVVLFAYADGADAEKFAAVMSKGSTATAQYFEHRPTIQWKKPAALALVFDVLVARETQERAIAERVICADIDGKLSDDMRTSMILEGVDCIYTTDFVGLVLECARAVTLRATRRALSKFQGKPQVRPANGNLAVWVTQLSQVPGISEDIARAIAVEYPTAPRLIEQLRRDAHDVANCQVIVKSVKGYSRVGVAIAKRLKQFFLAEDPDVVLE